MRLGASGGLQDGDCSCSQACGETKMHQSAKRSLCQSASESQKGLFDRADRMLIINNFPPCAEIPAGDQGVVLQPQTLSARK